MGEEPHEAKNEQTDCDNEKTVDIYHHPRGRHHTVNEWGEHIAWTDEAFEPPNTLQS